MLLLHVFKEVDTRGGNHDEKKPGCYFIVFFFVHLQIKKKKYQ